MSNEPARLPETGTLAARPLPALLVDLHLAAFEGALVLVGGQRRKRFVFKAGAPVQAESNLSGETLGALLIDKGVIDRAQYENVCAHMQKKGCQEGVALLALGLVSPKELFLALKEQVGRRLVECFGWPDGDFTLDPQASVDDDVQPFRNELVALIQEGMESHWPVDRILTDLSRRMDLYPRPVTGFNKVARRLRVDDAGHTLLAGLDGRRTMGRAMGAALNSPRALAAAWLLDRLGVLAYSEEAPEGLEGVVDFGAEIELEVDGAATEGAADPGAGRRAQARSVARKPREHGKDRAAEGEGLRGEIEKFHAGLDEMDHYALLGLEHDVAPVKVKKAYLKAAKRYHPDALTRLGLDDLKSQAAEVFARIAEAFEVLGDADRRKSYDASLRGESVEVDTARLAQAEKNYRKGEILVRMGDFKGALEYLEPAVDLWPDECAYQSALGWALYKASPSNPDRARAHLAQAVALDDADAITHFRFGMVLRSLGEQGLAADHLARAKALDPKADSSER